MSAVGAYAEATAVTAEVKEIVSGKKAECEAKAGTTFATFEPLTFVKQVVAGINYKVKVKASEYAKYYFLLRSMTIKSGLAGNETSPLDVQGAKRLQEMSGSYQSAAVAKSIRPGNLRGYRSMSAPSAQFLKDAAKATAEIPGKVSLERIVKM